MASLILTPIKAIRKNCLECAETAKEVKACPIKDCPLYKYRLGTNPGRKGIGGRKLGVRGKKGNLSRVISTNPGIVVVISQPNREVNHELANNHGGGYPRG